MYYIKKNLEIDELKKLVSELSVKIGSLKAQTCMVTNGHFHVKQNQLLLVNLSVQQTSKLYQNQGS